MRLPPEAHEQIERQISRCCSQRVSPIEISFTTIWSLGKYTTLYIFSWWLTQMLQLVPAEKRMQRNSLDLLSRLLKAVYAVADHWLQILNSFLNVHMAWKLNLSNIIYCESLVHHVQTKPRLPRVATPWMHHFILYVRKQKYFIIVIAKTYFIDARVLHYEWMFILTFCKQHFLCVKVCIYFDFFCTLELHIDNIYIQNIFIDWFCNLPSNLF